MEIIINDYYKSNLSTNINFYWLERNRKFLFEKTKFIKKNNGDAIYLISDIVDGSYSVNLDNSFLTNISIKYNENIINDSKKIYFNIKNSSINKIKSDEFIKKEYQLKLGISKSVRKLWNLYWNSLHHLSFSYPLNPSNEDKEQIINLTNKMQENGLSCPRCLSHFRKWNTKYPIKNFCISRKKLIHWYINLHNDVNKRNKKMTLNYTQVERLYKNFNYKELVDKYNINIIFLFKIRQLDKFPDIINNNTKKILWKEFDIFQNI